MATSSANPIGDLASLFTKKTDTRVSYQKASPYGEADLLVDPEDDLITVMEKTDRCREIVERGESLAVALGTIPPDSAPIDYKRLAKDGMNHNERLQYEAWEKGYSLPPLDVSKDRAKPGFSQSERTRDERRLAWLRRAYKEPELTLENLAWFYKKHQSLIPLVCAGARVIGVERDRTGNNKRDPRDLAEQQAAARLQGSAAARVAVIKEEINRITGAINTNNGVIQARKVAMQPPPADPKHPKKRAPENEMRKAVGEHPIGVPKRWNAPGATGRVRSLLGGTGGKTPNPYATGSGIGLHRMTMEERGKKRRLNEDRGREASPVYTPKSPRGADVGQGEAEMEVSDEDL